MSVVVYISELIVIIIAKNFTDRIKISNSVGKEVGNVDNSELCN